VSGVLVIACGALAGELRAVLTEQGLAGVDVHYLPANLHNRPERIVPAIAEVVDGHDGPVFIAYADCGTGGGLDRFLAEHPGIERLPGAHCYEMFAGGERFAALHEAEPGTFYLTDFLAKHFDVLVWQGLGLDRHPSLRDAYFGNYTRVVLLSQRPDAALVTAGEAAAARLGLDFEHVPTGLATFADAVAVGLSPRVR
jgi:protein tyrosine phosphatase (PTP) superfamily phosphohydrolase (DUF442 family)